jgi:hypothetical protein
VPELILAFPKVARKKKRPIREEIGRFNALARIVRTSIVYQLRVISASDVTFNRSQQELSKIGFRQLR